MKQVIGHLKDQPDVAAIYAEMESTMESKKKFAEKFIKDFEDDMQAIHKSYWDRIGEALVQKKLLPEEYKKETHVIGIYDDNEIYIQKKEDKHRYEIAEKIARALPPDLVKALMD